MPTNGCAKHYRENCAECGPSIYVINPNTQPTQPTASALHTPAPWRSAPTGKRMSAEYSQSMAIVSADDKNLIAGLFSDVKGGAEVAKANADFIIRAVNTYEQTQADLAELREAAKELHRVLQKMVDIQEGCAVDYTEADWIEARAVLARHPKP